MKSFKIIFLSLIALSILSISSCKKSEGQGGKASITGKIWIQRYSDLLVPLNNYPGAYEDVYIIYGNDATYGDKVKANPDGVYEFKYLRPGYYKIYAYSSGYTVSGKVAVIKQVEITEKKQTVECETINLAK